MISLNLGYPPIRAKVPDVSGRGACMSFEVDYPPPRRLSFPVIRSLPFRAPSSEDGLVTDWKPAIGTVEFRHDRTIDGVAYYL
jgi:hypothetical protein